MPCKIIKKSVLPSPDNQSLRVCLVFRLQKLPLKLSTSFCVNTNSGVYCVHLTQGQGQTPSICSHIEKNTNYFLARVVSYIKPHKFVKQFDWSKKDLMQENQIQQNYPGIKLTCKKECKACIIRKLHETHQQPQKKFSGQCCGRWLF